MLNCEQDVDGAGVDVQLDDLLELLLADLADTSLDLGDLPDENLTVCCSRDSLLRAWQEDCLGVGLLLLG